MSREFEGGTIVRTLLVFLVLMASITASGATVTVILKGVKSDDGKLYVRVVEKHVYELDEAIAVETSATIDASAGDVKIEIKNVPPGEYAVTALHDKNGNLDMDYNFLGIPKEYWGLSRDPKVSAKTRKPTWEMVKFELTEEDKTVEVKMRRLR